MKKSICDDCVHQVVCKHRKEIQSFEDKIPEYGTVVGPVVTYSVACSCKNTEEDYQQR